VRSSPGTKCRGQRHPEKNRPVGYGVSVSRARANLLFALMGAATAVFAGCELWMMGAETLGRIRHRGMVGAICPSGLLCVSLVGFVRLYLGAGRLWLAWTACGLRTLSLILNFLYTPNQNKENLLSAAGFKVIVPKTATQQQKLKALPADKVTLVQKDGKNYYVFPDAANNQAYVGGPTQYQA
jgi:hypothetical protein